jgi:sugar/nucleoside kinase (ribokinase family)
MKTPIGLFIGLSTYDIVVSSDDTIKMGVKIDAISLWKGAGGPATNAAIAFKQLGGESHLISRIGNSTLGIQIKNELNKLGVTFTDIEDEKSSYEPPLSFITVNSSGEKTIISSISNQNKTDFQTANRFKGLKNIDIVCFDKHLGFKQIELLDYFDITPKVYDPGRPSETAIELINEADYTIAPDYSEYFSLGAKYLDKNKMFAISRGDNSIEILGKGKKEINIRKVNVIDTMGAGDILHGAFSFYKAKGINSIDSLIKASQTATESTTHWGARIKIS